MLAAKTGSRYMSCSCGAVVEAIEGLFERCWPDLRSFKKWTEDYYLIAQSMKAGDALCEGKSASNEDFWKSF